MNDSTTLSYQEARTAGVKLSRARRQTEDSLREAINTAAQKNAVYRQAKAEAIVTAKAEHPATVAVEIAQGSKTVRDADIERRVADGMVDVFKERLRLHDQDRATLHRLMEWSMKVAPDGELPQR